MSYRETRRRCQVCGRETVHWLPRLDTRPDDVEGGLRPSVASFFGLLRMLPGRQWRCLDCDHPWHASLLHRRLLP